MYKSIKEKRICTVVKHLKIAMKSYDVQYSKTSLAANRAKNVITYLAWKQGGQVNIFLSEKLLDVEKLK